MNALTAQILMFQPFGVPMRCVFVPFIPQMTPIVQVAQQIPDLNHYCQCNNENFGCASSRALIDHKDGLSKKELPSPSYKLIEKTICEADTKVSGSNNQLMKLKIADLPRKHKSKSKIIQRLSSLSSESKILKEIKGISNLNEIIFKATPKSHASQSTSQRMRSRYIGVCHKNGMYNAYIVANGKKTYICGTKNEEITARYYDYCAILLHGKAATTNFSYTKRQLMEMLRSGGICLDI
ncbi:unnamed protein product [Moneuplotes crassus]|uniref:AP2/ERF domain-containing protein n=1 Tax=Euplotes crassus TaxID=5936 RepID=A0AAD1Y323_EUPCR|nr:unnamed protein product [Moneuplotes crassus]